MRTEAAKCTWLYVYNKTIARMFIDDHRVRVSVRSDV